MCRDTVYKSSFRIISQVQHCPTNYETVVKYPNKRIHPDIISGKMTTENARYIINYDDDKQTEKNKETDEIDPRWDTLKKILTDKNL